MKKYYTIFLALILLQYLYSCHRKKDNYDTNIAPGLTDSLVTVIKQSSVKSKELLKISNCLILPVDIGCESCIEKTLSFITNNANKNNIFIITSQSSTLLKENLSNYKYKLNQFQKDNIAIDTSNSCFSLGLSDVTPRIYKLKDGKIISVDLLYAVNIDEDLLDIQ